MLGWPWSKSFLLLPASHLEHENISVYRGDPNIPSPSKVHASATEQILRCYWSSWACRSFMPNYISSTRGESYLFWVFSSSLETDALAWFLRLKPNNISFFKQLSTEFVRNYSLLVEELKMTNSLLEVIVRPCETFKSYIMSFESTLRMIAKPKRCLALTVFKRGLLLARKPLKDHLVISNLIFDCIEIYSGAKILIL